jgi:hypothetical protein
MGEKFLLACILVLSTCILLFTASILILEAVNYQQMWALLTPQLQRLKRETMIN